MPGPRTLNLIWNLIWSPAARRDVIWLRNFSEPHSPDAAHHAAEALKKVASITGRTGIYRFCRRSGNLPLDDGYDPFCARTLARAFRGVEAPLPFRTFRQSDRRPFTLSLRTALSA